MPLHYENDGTALDGGCPRLGAGCTFVHPSEGNWDSAPPSKRKPTSQRTGPFGRRKSDAHARTITLGPWEGKPSFRDKEASGSRGEDSWMSRARARSAPNTDINLEAGVGGKSKSGASAWGSSTWGESTWGTPADDVNNKNLDKGKGKATEGSVGKGSGWAHQDDFGWGAKNDSGWGTRGESGWEMEADSGWEPRRATSSSSWGTTRDSGWGTKKVVTEIGLGVNTKEHTSSGIGGEETTLKAGNMEWGTEKTENDSKEEPWPTTSSQEEILKVNEAEKRLDVHADESAEGDIEIKDTYGDTRSSSLEVPNPDEVVMEEHPLEPPKKKLRVTDEMSSSNTPVREFEDSQLPSRSSVVSDTRRTQDATSDKTVSYVLKIKDLPLPLDSSPTSSIFLPKGSTQFGDISYKQAREYWQIIISQLSRAIRLRVSWEKATSDLQHFRDAEHSSIYQKSGNKAASMLESEKRRLRYVADKLGKDYRETIMQLISFENKFDFPLDVLTQEGESVTQMRDETYLLRRFIHDSMIYVEQKKAELDNTTVMPQSSSEETLVSWIPEPEIPKPEGTISIVSEDSSESHSFSSRLKRLRDCACDLSYKDVGIGSDLPAVVKEKIRELRLDYIDNSEELQEFKELGQKLAEKHAAFDEEVTSLADNIGNIHLDMDTQPTAEDTNLDCIKTKLAEIREVVGLQQSLERTIEILLQTWNDELQQLKEKLRLMCIDDKSSVVSDEGMNQIVSSVLSTCTEQVLGEWDEVSTQFLEDTKTILDERMKKIVDKLAPILLTVLEIPMEVQRDYEQRDLVPQPPVTRA